MSIKLGEVTVALWLCQTENATGTRTGTSEKMTFNGKPERTNNDIDCNYIEHTRACSSTVRAGDS